MTDKDGLDQHPEGFPIPVGGSEYYDEPLGKMVKSNVQNDLLWALQGWETESLRPSDPYLPSRFLITVSSEWDKCLL